MKTSIINNLAALLTVSGLSLTAPLTVTAQNLVVSNSAVTASGTHYENNGTASTALAISGSLGFFTGTGVTLTGTGDPGSGNGRYAATVGTRATLNLTDSNITANLYGINTSGASVIALQNTNITAGSGSNGNVRTFNLTASSTLTMTGGTLTSAGLGAYATGRSTMFLRGTVIDSYTSGIWLSATSAAVLENLTITTQAGQGLEVRGSSTATMTNSSITTTLDNSGALANVGSFIALTDVNIDVLHTTGSNCSGIRLESASTGIVIGGTITTRGTKFNGMAVWDSSSMTASGVTINVSGSQANGVLVRNATWSGTNITVTASGPSGNGLHLENGGQLELTGGVIRTAGADASGASLSGTSSAALSNVNLVSQNGHGVNMAASSTLTMTGGTIAAASSVVNAGGGAGNTVTLTGVTGSGSNLLSASGDAGLTLTANNSTLIGNFTASDDSVATLTLTDSALTGASSVSDDAALTVSLDNDSTWTMTADSQVTNLALNNSGKVIFQKDAGFKTLTTRNLSGSGIFEMNTDIVSGTADRLIVSGTSAGSHQVRITNHGAQTLGTEPALLLIETADGQATFNGSVSVGMFDYSLYQDQTDWYLSVSGTNLPPNPPTPPGGDDDPPQPPQPPTPPAPPTISDGGKIILIVPPSIGQNWFDHTKTISNHLGDLRDDKAGILESLWVRSYGAQLNIAPNMVGSGVREYQYGVDVGSDHRWNLDKDNTLILGGFVGYGRIDRTLRNSFGSEANTDNYHAGLYAIWLHECGLWADIIAKGQYADSQLSAWDASQNHMTASYGNWGGGVTLDLGKKFSFDQGWFVEPSVSAGYAHFMGNDYTTGGNNVFAVSISDADLFQFRVGVAFGRTLKLRNSGVLQPYLKVAGVEQISTGGKLSASGHEWRPNFDGTRAEVGGGIIWQLNADHQLSLDYEASFGDKYDKPWGLTAGYRYQF